MTTATKLITAEEFWRLPDEGGRRSLVRGVIEETMPPGARHGGIASILDRRLGGWSEQQRTGWVGIESGFILDYAPDVVRAPDVSFVRAERIPPTGVPEGFWPLAPDLAVEVVSPSETAQAVREKISDYLAAGTLLVWVIYPKSREVVAHTPDGFARTFRATDILAAPDVLPGFACPVADLFTR
jgi:Uma2 family endonuclease